MKYPCLKPPELGWGIFGRPGIFADFEPCLSIMLVIVVPPVLCVFTNTTGDGEHCSYEPS